MEEKYCFDAEDCGIWDIERVLVSVANCIIIQHTGGQDFVMPEKFELVLQSSLQYVKYMSFKQIVAKLLQKHQLPSEFSRQIIEMIACHLKQIMQDFSLAPSLSQISLLNEHLNVILFSPFNDVINQELFPYDMKVLCVKNREQYAIQQRCNYVSQRPQVSCTKHFTLDLEVLKMYQQQQQIFPELLSDDSADEAVEQQEISTESQETGKKEQVGKQQKEQNYVVFQSQFQYNCELLQQAAQFKSGTVISVERVHGNLVIGQIIMNYEYFPISIDKKYVQQVPAVKDYFNPDVPLLNILQLENQAVPHFLIQAKKQLTRQAIEFKYEEPEKIILGQLTKQRPINLNSNQWLSIILLFLKSKIKQFLSFAVVESVRISPLQVANYMLPYQYNLLIFILALLKQCIPVHNIKNVLQFFGDQKIITTLWQLLLNINQISTQQPLFCHGETINDL